MLNLYSVFVSFLFNESFQSNRWQMEGTVDRSINKHLCLHLNLQMKNKGKHDKCSLLELKYENGSCSGE